MDGVHARALRPGMMLGAQASDIWGRTRAAALAVGHAHDSVANEAEGGLAGSKAAVDAALLGPHQEEILRG